jgi:hypothetical protein
MFDIFFTWQANDLSADIRKIDEFIVPPWATEYEKKVLSHQGFAVR